ncbi:MAG: DNA-3-methyladenine glycosylase 2 family protein, partial [Bacteroidota bacterium]
GICCFIAFAHNLLEVKITCRKDDLAVRKTLKQIKGIGPWTIDMILLYTLKRPDIFPAGDFHLKQVMSKCYETTDSSSLGKQLKAIASQWIPYRSYAVRYLLDWKNQQP